MAILESVRELASKLGADTNGRTIADQINIINRHLEADTANDIAGAVKEYSKKAGSGGGTSFSKFVFPDQDFWLHSGELRSAPELAIILKANNGEYSIRGNSDLPPSPRIICLEPLVSFTLTNFDSPTVIFTPAETYNAFEQATGDTVTPGDGKLYIYTEGRTQQGVKTYTMKKYNTDFVYSIT